MADISGIEALVLDLRRRAAKAEQGNCSVVVGYTAKYALFVHKKTAMKLKGIPRPSGLGVYWGPSGEALFLENSARRLLNEMKSIIVKSLRKGLSMAQTLLMCGLRLQRETQKHTPVEYGNLRASAFTRLEK